MRARSSGSALLKAANATGADFLMVGGIHKMSTLVQWAKAEVIDLRTGQIVLDKLFTFRGGHRSGLEARRGVHSKRTHYACSSWWCQWQITRGHHQFRCWSKSEVTARYDKVRLTSKLGVGSRIYECPP